jgi:hypothetical protein
MMNPLATYIEAGRKYSEAMNDKDYSRARFHNDWVTRAIRLESTEDRPACEQAYREGLQAGRNQPLPL